METKIKKVVIVLLLVSFVGAVYLIAKNSREKLEMLNVKMVKNYPDDLRGKVYMTLKEKNTENLGIYSFDLDENKIEMVYVPQDCYAVGGEISPVKNEMVISSNCGVEKETSQIQILDLDTKEITRRIAEDANDQFKRQFKKEAVWANDGENLAFIMENPNAEGEEVDRAFAPDNWNVFMSDNAGQEKFVTTAVHPFFSPDGKKMLVLGYEGLFLVDLEISEGERVHAFKTNVPASMQLGLSKNKDLLSISNPIEKNIVNFRIKSWEPFEMESIDEIKPDNVSVSWPKIAPDEKYLIDEELFKDGKIELAAYDLETKERYPLLDLSSYAHDSLWINDWK